MKIYCLFSLLFLFLNFSSAQPPQKRSILVYSVHFHTTTIISVLCENFLDQFQRQLKINKVYNQDSIAMLDLFLNKIKFSKRNFNMDTRAKLIYESKAGTELTFVRIHSIFY